LLIAGRITLGRLPREPVEHNGFCDHGDSVTQLNQKARESLPDSAFAYVDSRGRRRLPVNDEAHVRNALARFNQTAFEDEAARDRARTRLLKAAKKYGIVPVGFMTGQLRSQSTRAAAGLAVMHGLPSGQVTFLLADIADSTGLVTTLGERYAALLADVRGMLRAAVHDSGGREVDVRADELFAVFEQARAAVEAALAIQRRVLARKWPEGVSVLMRIGLHTGLPTLTDTGYVGLVVHTTARICFAAHGGQIVVSRAVREEMEGSQASGPGFRDLGLHRLQGLPMPEALFQVEAPDLPIEFPPPRIGVSGSAKPARRRPPRPVANAGDDQT
jgi:class 3 adenylate cyclase